MLVDFGRNVSETEKWKRTLFLLYTG